MTDNSIVSWTAYLTEINDRLQASAEFDQGDVALIFEQRSRTCRWCGSDVIPHPLRVRTMELERDPAHMDDDLGWFSMVVWAECVDPNCKPNDLAIADAIKTLGTGCLPLDVNFSARSERAKSWRSKHLGNEATS